MFAKTVCKPGATVVAVPVGLLITLQYNANGILERIFSGYGDLKSDVTSSTKAAVQQAKLVPSVITIKGGTTWVEGVLYTSKQFHDVGYLPACVKDSMIDYLNSNASDYMFYAGRVSSLGASLVGANNIRTWLQLAGFTLLPSFLAPAEFSMEYMKTQLMRNKMFCFNYPMLSGLMVFENESYRFIPSNLSQSTITKVERFNTPEGYIQARLYDVNGSSIVQYSDVISYDIQKGTSIVKDRNGKIIASYRTSDKVREKVSDVIVCSCCGNLFRAPKFGPVTCTDDQCTSRMYPVLSHFLKVLNLKPLSVTAFQESVKKGQLITLADVFSLDKYKDEKVTVDIPTLVESCVPIEVCADKNVFISFANTCFNSIDTVKYYLNTPSRLVDIHATNLFGQRFKEWLSEPANRLTLLALLGCDNIVVDNKSIKKFEGSPIFRGKNIFLTGTFQHGDYQTVASIIRSYSANIVTEFDDSTHLLLIGDFKGNIDGKAVAAARLNEIPSMTESEFFSKYDIDADMKKLNLL